METRLQWTEKEIEILKKMSEAHKDVRLIAKVLKNRSLDAIRIKAQKMGFVVSPQPEIDMEIFKKIMGGK